MIEAPKIAAQRAKIAAEEAWEIFATLLFTSGVDVDYVLYVRQGAIPVGDTTQSGAEKCNLTAVRWSLSWEFSV